MKFGFVFCRKTVENGFDVWYNIPVKEKGGRDMKYTEQEVLQYVQEEDVKFIRMAFCDLHGNQKNISIMPGELPRAFSYGIAIDGSAVPGFGSEVHSDLLLHPDPSTLSLLPWRPDHGRVVRMFCGITRPDGTPFEADSRALLSDAVAAAEKEGLRFSFGPEMEFYLFRRDEAGEPTREPYDRAGYMDIAPEDRGENVRREICLTLEQMGIIPESSHHEEGPGQNEIDFRYADPLRAADNAVTFRAVVNTIAARSGLYADFSPKPLENEPGNGMHINLSVTSKDGRDPMGRVLAGILTHIPALTLFLNPVPASYRRFGAQKAPRFVSWSAENRSQLIRIPAAEGEFVRAELRSPDPMCNPYLAFALLIYAGIDGVKRSLDLPPALDRNLYDLSEKEARELTPLPASLEEARLKACGSSLLREALPASVLAFYLK